MKTILAIATLACSLTAFSQSIVLEWSYPKHLLDTNIWFEIYCGTNLTVSNWTHVATVQGPTTEWHTTLEHQRYYFGVRARNRWGRSDFPKRIAEIGPKRSPAIAPEDSGGTRFPRANELPQRPPLPPGIP